MKTPRDPMTWVRRVSFAVVLLVTALTPGMTPGWASQPCPGHRCGPPVVRWIRALPGTWVVQPGLAGTTPVQGQAYLGAGRQVTAVGSGLSVAAYAARTGAPLWTTLLSGFPAGSAIVSVRSWPGVVTVGVAPPSGTGGAQHGRTPHPGGTRTEVILKAATGQRWRAYPAAPFGGAVAAGPTATVVVGAHAVTSYLNRTGTVAWRRPTGPVPQAWQADGGHLYVAVSAHGYLGSAPVTALRRIDLRTGAERLLRPLRGTARGRARASGTAAGQQAGAAQPGRPHLTADRPAASQAFAGRLSMAVDGVAVFSGAAGTTAYSGTTGTLLWRRAAAQPDAADAIQHRLYLLSGNVLAGVDPWSGATLGRVTGAAAAATSSGLYGVRDGSVLGLDHGAAGKAWGYDVARQRISWTTRPLPWPHYFADLSGIGGSAPPGSDVVVLAICAQLAAPAAGGEVQRCARPELAALNR